MSSMLITSLLIAIVSVAVCQTLARRRGANTMFWGVMGAIFGPFAIPFAFMAKKRPVKVGKASRSPDEGNV